MWRGPSGEHQLGLMTCVTGVQHPVVVVGDFNVQPEEFMTTTMGSIMQVAVLATWGNHQHGRRT